MCVLVPRRLGVISATAFSAFSIVMMRGTMFLSEDVRLMALFFRSWLVFDFCTGTALRTT